VFIFSTNNIWKSLFLFNIQKFIVLRSSILLLEKKHPFLFFSFVQTFTWKEKMTVLASIIFSGLKTMKEKVIKKEKTAW